MRKYLEIFRWSFKMQIVWRFDVAMTMVATTGRIAAAWILWRAVFTGREMVNGFTFEAMLSYYIIGSFLASLDMSNQISGEVSHLIKDGGFSKHMVTPINPFGFFGYMIAGECVFHLAFSFAAATVCAILFQIKIIITPDTIQLLLAGIMVLLGLFFMAGYHYLIGILAFKFVDIGFFLHVQGSIIAFATGALVPLSLLPKTAVQILRFLPFTHVIFTPAMLITGQVGIGEGVFGFAVLTGWAAAIMFVGQTTYKRLRVRYEGVGI